MKQRIKRILGVGHISKSSKLEEETPTQPKLCQYYTTCTKKSDDCTNEAVCRLRIFYEKYPNYQELGIGSRI